MCSSLSTKKYNSTSSQYLVNLDLINKYNSKTLYDLPEVKKIILHFSIKDFLESLKISNKIEITSNTEIKSILLFYMYFSLFQYINFKKIKGKNDSVNDFSLKISLSKKDEISSFLIGVLIEQNDLIKQENLFRLKKSQKIFEMEYKTLCYNCLIPIAFFLNTDDIIIGTNEKDIGLKNLNIKASFIINNTVKSKNNNNLIRNIPFFWVNKLKQN